MPPKHCPLIISHRGNIDGPSPETENTIGAIRQAFTLAGLDGIELDVDMTRDGILVLNHRDEGGAPPTRSLTYRELLQHYRRPVPPLSEALRELRTLLDAHPPANTFTINMELKRDPEAAVPYPDDYAAMVPDILISHLKKNEFIISTFDQELVRRLKKSQAGIPVGLILPDNTPAESLTAAIWYAEADFLAAHAALLRRGSETREILREVAKVYVWTVDDDAGLTAFCQEKWLSCLITNRPRRALALRQSPA